MASYTLKGINDDFDTCANCGKTGLKRVMWLAELDFEGGEIAAQPYGTTCGARLLKLKVTSKAKIERKVNEMLIEQIDNKTAEIMSGFFSYARRYLLPLEAAMELMRNEITLKRAFEKRVEMHPLLGWLMEDRSFANAQKYSRYL